MISLQAWGSVSTRSPVFFKTLAHLQYEEMGDQHEHDVAVPSSPGPGLAVVQPEAALALLEATGKSRAETSYCSHSSRTTKIKFASEVKGHTSSLRI